MTSRRLFILAHDLATTVVALFAAFLLRWGGTEFLARIEPIAIACLATVPVALAAFWFVRLPQSPWKYASIPDLGRIAASAAIPAAFLVLLDFLARGQFVVPRTVPIIYWLVQVALLTGPRVAYRVYRTRRRERRAFVGLHRTPVLIAGTDDGADQLIRRLRRDAVSSLDPVGLLTVKAREKGEVIHGVPILGEIGEIEAVLAKLAARDIRPRRLILTRTLLGTSADIDGLLGDARRLGLSTVRVSETLTDMEGPDAPLRLAPVSIDDLLGRASRELDLGPVRELVAGRDVLVTGAGGSIGQELCRQIAAMAPRRIVLFEQSELALWQIAHELRALHPECALVERLGNVRDPGDVERVFDAFRPDLVFHAAALKHVDLVEAHPVAAAATNTIGTLNVARAARSRSLCAVFISTDKAVDPVSVLGATKRAGEIVFAAFDARSRSEAAQTRFLNVRFGNVLGSSGSVIPLFTEQLRHGGPVTVTHPEVERYFMTISEAVRLVLLASASGLRAPDGAATFVLDMGRPIRIVDLARRMIRLAGLEPDVDVAIAFSGLRPGERLTEMLESDRESLRETDVPGVRATEPPSTDLAALEARLTRLEGAIAAHDEAGVRGILSELVPEYRGAPSGPEGPGTTLDRPGRPRLRLVK